MNAIGLICAAGAGAAQPLMSLLFGRLTQNFVEFGTVLNMANAGDPDALQQLGAAAAGFRHAAAQNASYLVWRFDCKCHTSPSYLRFFPEDCSRSLP